VRIGIDYLPAVAHAPGVGRYARELVRALVRLDGRPDLALFEVGRAERTVDERSLGLTIGDPRVRRLRRRLSRRALSWIPFSIAAADRMLGGVDLFHHVLLESPRVDRARETLAVSELPAPGSRAEESLRTLLSRVDGVIVFSSDYQRELSARYAALPARVHRVSVGCEHWRRELGDFPPLEQPPLVLVLGAQRSSRRHATILRAFELLLARGVEATLMLVGGAGNATAELKSRLAASNAQAHVVCMPSRRESEMPGLVARSSVLVQLEDDAGTPVTPLEAFAVGVPVVASRLRVFEEALGRAALYVDNDEVVRAPERLADAFERAIASAADPDARELRFAIARTFTWERNARETLEVWRRLVQSA
jgi:glycosyltransferase involved in cell wall biosynthesis